MTNDTGRERQRMTKEADANAKVNRVHRYTIRFTEDEAKAIEDNASIAGMTFANYIRHSALGVKIKSRLELKMIAELKRVGGLLKLVHTESKGAYSEKTSQALDTLWKYVEHLIETT